MLRQNQARFKPQILSSDQICTLRIIIDQIIEIQGNIHIGTLDFEEIFGINSSKILKILDEYRITERVRILNDTNRTRKKMKKKNYYL